MLDIPQCIQEIQGVSKGDGSIARASLEKWLNESEASLINICPRITPFWGTEHGK